MEAEGCQFLGGHIRAEYGAVCTVLNQLGKETCQLLLCPPGVRALVKTRRLGIRVARLRDEGVGM